MKKVNLTGYGLMTALAMLTACNDGIDFADGTGTISPLVDYDPTVISARAASGTRAAAIGDITVDDLTLTLVSEDGSVNESFLASEFPADRGFAVGKYTLSASYGDPEAEGFELPAVFGEAELSVTEGKATQVALTATPSKAMVTVKFDESLTNYMTECSARLHTPGGAYIDYATTETRPVYLKPGNVALSVSFTKPNGKGGTLEVTNFTAEARTHYTMTLSLGGDGVGEVSSLTVSFDETLQSEDVTVDISDQLLSTPAPEVTPRGFTNGELFSCVEGSGITAQPRFHINAQGGIAHATLTTSCPSLIGQGWPEEIDLANAPASTQQLMTSLGLKDIGLFRNPGTIAEIDFSNVPAHISATAVAASPAEFTLVVTDKAGKSSEPVGFKVKVDKLELSLSTESTVYGGEPTIDITVGYNGTAPIESAVEFQYMNKRGVFAPTTVAKAVAKTARAGVTEYIVTLNVPEDALAPLTIKAICGSVKTDELKISMAPTLSVNANDVFARSAWVTLSSDEYNCDDKTIELYASTNGTDFSKLTGAQSGADFHITGGLNPATNYTLRATVDGVNSTTVTITTEAATALQNGSLNDGWTSEERKTGAANGTFHFAPSPWNTVNEVSFSNMSMGSSYSMLSCTEPSTDSHNGNAALIRTVGYGNSTLFSKPSHYVAGELYLGSYNNGAQYGIDFTSRPAAVNFWYKYSRYTDADRGLAEVKVFDTAGNVIASGSKAIDNTSAYTQANIPLTYNRGAAKAAKIQVNFKSTDQAVGESSVNRQSNNYSYGAALYVDDVELVY